MRRNQVRREVQEASETDHDWVSLSSIKIDPFTSFERLTTMLCVFITETAIVAFMFGDPNEVGCGVSLTAHRQTHTHTHKTINANTRIRRTRRRRR